MKKLYTQTLIGIGVISPIAIGSGLIIYNEKKNLAEHNYNNEDFLMKNNEKVNYSDSDNWGYNTGEYKEVNQPNYLNTNRIVGKIQEIKKVSVDGGYYGSTESGEVKYPIRIKTSDLKNKIIGDMIDSGINYNDVKIDLKIDFGNLIWWWGHIEYKIWYEDLNNLSSNPSSKNFFSEVNKKISSIKKISDLNEPIIMKQEYKKWGGSDYSKIILTFEKEEWNYSSEYITFNLSVELEAHEKSDGGGWGNSQSVLVLEKTNIVPKVTLKTTLPYTENERRELPAIFDSIFKNRNFVFKSKSLIAFPSGDSNIDSNNNKLKIEKEVENRINEFWKNDKIANSKLGNIINSCKITWKILTTDNYGNTTLEFELKLNDGLTFEFVKGAVASNSISAKMRIKIKPIANESYDIGSLIKIDPYSISGQGYSDFSKKWKGRKTNISDNTPFDNEFKSFSFNLNKVINGEANLIPIEKMPIVSRYGSTISLIMSINIDSTIIRVPVTFKKIFGNGKMVLNQKISPIILSNGSEISFKNNILSLSLEIIGNNIYLKNDGPIKLNFKKNDAISSKIPRIALDIESAEALIPEDQLVKPSNWKTITEKIAEDNNGVTNAGSYQTEDPFYFQFTNTTIPIQVGGKPTYDSRYKPFINDVPLGLSSNDEYFKSDLGPYVMKEKEGGGIDLKIEIKEFDPTTNSYSSLKYYFTIRVDLINSAASYLLSGWDNPNQISEDDKKKFFNMDDKENYRGDFANEDTGMYIPKIAWVNSMPPEGFLFDPRDELGNLITGFESGGNANFDIGYIAEINAPAFVDGDFPSMPTIGGYETYFDKSEFMPTGSFPYNVFYKYESNSIIPIINKIPLLESGTLTNNKLLRQVVLKRMNNFSFLYQFSLIPKNKSELKKNIFDLYSKFIGNNDKPLFIDFWDTHHGNNLFNFLVGKGIISGEKDAKKMPYNEVIQYWSIYVNNPENYENNEWIPSNNAYDISKLELDKQFSKINNLLILKEEFRKNIKSNLNKMVNEESYIPNNYFLTEGIDYRIEKNDLELNKKLNELIANYDKPLNESKSVSFNIIAIDPDFTIPNVSVDNWYIKGQTKIEYLNNKYIDDIVDLNNFKGPITKFNSSLKDFVYGNWSKNKIIKELIYRDVSESINKFYKENSVFSNTLILEKDYILKFYTIIYDNVTGQYIKQYYTSIEKAIEQCLLFESDKFEFDNTLYVDVLATNNTSTIKNKFLSTFNNSSNNKIYEQIVPIDLSKINVNPINLNSQHKDFPIGDKVKTIKELIYERISIDIDFYTRFLYQQTGFKPLLGTDYNLVFINEDDKNNIIFYPNIDDAIINCLLKDVDINPNFDNKLIVKIVSIKESQYLYNSFDKNVNNNYSNDSIEIDPGVPGITNPDTSLPPIIDDNLSTDFEKPQYEKTNIVWIISPIIVISALIFVGVTIFIIRKNKQIK